MSTDASYDVLVPLAMRHLGSGPSVLLETAADAIVALMRAVQKPYQRTEILCRLLREYAQGQSCHKRLAFLNAAAVMQERYSRRCALWPHGLRHCHAVHARTCYWPIKYLVAGVFLIPYQPHPTAYEVLFDMAPRLCVGMCRFFKANVVSWVCNLASDVTVSVRMRSASVMASARRSAESAGDADLAATLEAPLTCLQGDVSAYVRACAWEVHTSLRHQVQSQHAETSTVNVACLKACQVGFSLCPSFQRLCPVGEGCSTSAGAPHRRCSACIHEEYSSSFQGCAA